MANRHKFRVFAMPLVGIAALVILGVFSHRVGLAATAFGAYLVVSGVAFALGVLQGSRRIKEPDLLDPLGLDALILRNVYGSKIKLFVYFVQLVLLCLSESLIWPISFGTVFSIPKISNINPLSNRFSSAVSLYQPVMFASISVAVSMLLIVGSSWFLPREPGIRQDWVLVLVLSVLIKLSAIALLSAPFAALLKSGLRDPYLSFIGIAISDLVVLVVGLASLANAATGGTVRLADLSAVATDIFTFARFKTLIGQTRNGVRWYDLLMVASGFLVYINGFKSILFKRDEFKRTEDDLLSVSNNLMAIGRYEDALEWLGRIERPGPRALLAFIMAYVALGRFDRARAAAMAWADARAILEDTREAVAEKLLVDSLASVASSLNGPDLAKATAHLAPTADPIHLSAVTESILLRKALTNEEALASLPDGNPRAALARAVAFMLTGDLGEAVESVEKFVPANRAEEMVGKSVVVRCAFFLCVAQPDSTNGETLKERIEEFAADLDTGAIVPRDDFERLDLANVVLVMADLGRWCKATSAEALETLGGTLLEDMRPEVEFATARRFSKATRTVRLKFLKRLTFPEASKRVA